MKKRPAILLLILILVMLVVGNAWAVPDGIWKNTTGTPAYSFYIQTYVGNAMLVVVAPNTDVFWVFMDADDDYTNGFSATEDLSGTAHKLTINFTSDDEAVAFLTFDGGSVSMYSLERDFQAPYEE